MADDRERNQGMLQGGKDVAGGGGQQAPGRNPQDDRSANDQQKGGQQAPGRNPDDDRSAGGGQREQDEGNKEGGQNEQTRR